MCGIAGVWNRVAGREAVNTMLQRMAHRGPDASGIYTGPRGLLGHRRLSIMDPSGGDQPLFSEDRSRAIVANGEIYNFRAWRRRLDSRHTFATTSDTEVLLHLYEELGPQMVSVLDGMYAFALADGPLLMAARDPIGIKPLYYGEAEGAFWFASEVDALAPHVPRVREFPPGTWYRSDCGFQRYYRVPDLDPEPLDVEAAVARVRATLEAAVVKRLMSDVPLGAFLSGGLDSSLIVALARRHLPGPLHTFAVGVEGSPDIEAARRVSRHVGTHHHEYCLSADEIRRELPRIIRALESYDVDLVRSAVPCHFTCRLAARHVKVVLTGEGADELFAGYAYYEGFDGDEAALHRELRRSVSSLHNINLQRVDRLTMRHSIEGRVPFLDLAMIELGQRIPASLKRRGKPPVEKWILRRAFEDLLPPEILWRKKQQFDEGSGTVAVLEAAVAEMMSEADASAYRAEHPDIRLPNREACVYHRIFSEVFPRPERVHATVAHWADRPPAGGEGRNP